MVTTRTSDLKWGNVVQKLGKLKGPSWQGYSDVLVPSGSSRITHFALHPTPVPSFPAKAKEDQSLQMGVFRTSLVDTVWIGQEPVSPNGNDQDIRP